MKKDLDLSQSRDRLRYIREKIVGLSGDRFGGLLGVSQDTVSTWERGVRQPKGEILIKMADLGECSVDWILEGRGKSPGGYSDRIFNLLDLSDIGKRIEYLRENGLRISRRDLAGQLGIDEARILGYERGELLPSLSVVTRFAELSGVTVDFIVLGKTTGDSNVLSDDDKLNKLERKLESLEKFLSEELKVRVKPSNKEIMPLNLVELRPKIPVIANVPAGHPIEILPSDVIDWIWVPDGALIKQGKEVFGVRVDGDSMSPSLLLGDYAIVIAQRSAENRDIVVCRLNGEAMIKEFERKKEHIILKSSNPQYSPIIVTPDDEFQIIGVVYGIGLRRLRH